jgi:adenylate cyclase
MEMEIERKFELNSIDFLEGLTGSYFFQSYLAKGSLLVRGRISGNTAWLTLKGSPVSAMSCPEWEYEIPVEHAKDMAKQPGVYGLEKTRYLIEHKGHTFEVDRYHGKLDGLYSAEVELESESIKVELPDWIGTEVTGNKEWSNESLARNGWPNGVRALRKS